MPDEKLLLPPAHNQASRRMGRAGKAGHCSSQLPIEKLKPARAGQGHVSPACLGSADRRGPQTQRNSQELFPD